MNPTATEQPPIPPELLQKIRRIEIRARRLVANLFLGEYHSVFRGRGLEFSEVREYQPGDDVRSIDWNVTARMGTPYVKKYVEERELTVLLVVDVSASEAFGTGAQTKGEVAAEVAALLAFAAVANNDRIGLLTFSDRIEKFVPPRKGSQHVLRIVRELLYSRPRGRGTDIAGALAYLTRVARRRSIIFLISDFLDRGFEGALRVAVQRHDLVAISLTDPRELSLPPLGLLELEDAETGQPLLLDTEDRETRRQYALAAAQRREERQQLLRSMAVDEVAIATDRSYVQPLMAFFQARARRI
ncbi:MAG: DUF58 domain-containing protein [Dehalococcoidia bacterium]